MSPDERNRSDRLVPDQIRARRARLRLHHAAKALEVATAETLANQFRNDCTKGLKERGKAILVKKFEQDGTRSGDLEPSRLRTAMRTAIVKQIEGATLFLAQDIQAIELYRRIDHERQLLIGEWHRAAEMQAGEGRRARKTKLMAGRSIHALDERRRALALRHDDEIRALMVGTIDHLGAFPSWEEVRRSLRPIQPDAYSLYPVAVVRTPAGLRTSDTMRLEFKAIVEEAAYRMRIDRSLTHSRMVSMSSAADIEVNDLSSAIQRWAENGPAPRSGEELTQALAKFGRKGQFVSQIIARAQASSKRPADQLANSEIATPRKGTTELPEI